MSDALAVRLTVPLTVAPATGESSDTVGGVTGTVGDTLDGVVHSIGFAPQEAMGEGFPEVAWEHAATAFQVSAWSYASLTQACRPLLANPSSVVGLTFDATVAWPTYDWMGVAKAGLESCSRYVARHLGPEGIRSNLVAAGPIRTMAAKSIPGFDTFEEAWVQRDGSGVPVEVPSFVAETVEEIALAFRAHRALGRASAMLVVQPPPSDAALPRALVERAGQPRAEPAHAP